MTRWYLLITLLLNLTNLNAANWLSQKVLEREQSVAIGREQEAIKVTKTSFFTDHVLVLFYASTCPHCHEFAPTLHRWAVNHKAAVLPLSFDNNPLAEFQHFLPATSAWVNAAFAGRPIHYPALFVINNKTHALYPVSIGSMGIGELRARMNVLIPKIKNYESRGGRS